MVSASEQQRIEKISAEQRSLQEQLNNIDFRNSNYRGSVANRRRQAAQDRSRIEQRIRTLASEKFVLRKGRQKGDVNRGSTTAQEERLNQTSTYDNRTIREGTKRLSSAEQEQLKTSKGAVEVQRKRGLTNEELKGAILQANKQDLRREKRLNNVNQRKVDVRKAVKKQKEINEYKEYYSPKNTLSRIDESVKTDEQRYQENFNERVRQENAYVNSPTIQERLYKLTGKADFSQGYAQPKSSGFEKLQSTAAPFSIATPLITTLGFVGQQRITRELRRTGSRLELQGVQFDNEGKNTFAKISYASGRTFKIAASTSQVAPALALTSAAIPTVAAFISKPVILKTVTVAAASGSVVNYGVPIRTEKFKTVRAKVQDKDISLNEAIGKGTSDALIISYLGSKAFNVEPKLTFTQTDLTLKSGQVYKIRTYGVDFRSRGTSFTTGAAKNSIKPSDLPDNFDFTPASGQESRLLGLVKQGDGVAFNTASGTKGIVSRFKITPQETERGRLTIEAIRNFQNVKGLTPKEFTANIKDLTPAQRKIFTKESITLIKNLKGQPFGSVVDANRLPSPYNKKLIGDLDIVSPLGKEKALVQLKATASSLNKQGFNIKVDAERLSLSQNGAKILEVKTPNSLTGSSPVAPPSRAGFQFQDFRAGQLAKGSSLGSGVKAPYLGDQIARKGSSIIDIRGYSIQAQDPNFQQAGAFIPKGKRTVKDIADFYRIVKGTSALTGKPDTSSQFLSTFSPAQQKVILSKVATDTGNALKFPLSLSPSTSSSRFLFVSPSFSPTTGRVLLSSSPSSSSSPSFSISPSPSPSPSFSPSPSLSPSPSPSLSPSFSPSPSLSPSPSPSPSPSISPSVSPSLSPSPSPSPSLSPSPSPSPSPFLTPKTTTTGLLATPTARRSGTPRTLNKNFKPKKPKKAYTPTLFSVFGGIKAKGKTKLKGFTGLENRPLLQNGRRRI